MRILSLGSDAEFFLNHRSDGLIPATAFNTPGSKLSPIPLTTAGTFHRDNISVEIQPPPGITPEDFSTNAKLCFEELTQMYHTLNIDLEVAPAVSFRSSMMMAEEAAEIGCEPDYCAYTGRKAEATTAELMHNIRTGSGHIHIGGIPDFDEEERQEVVKHADNLEGLTCALHDAARGDIAYQRRRYYGQAGRYRIKPYGVEWRTPSNSNWWKYVYDNGAHSLFGSISAAISLVEQGVTSESIIGREGQDAVQKAINDGGYTDIERIHAWCLDKYNANPIAMKAGQAALKEYCDVSALIRA